MTAANRAACLRTGAAFWKKSRLVFFSIALFLLISVGVLTSLGQIMLHTDFQKGTFVAGVRSLVLDNPVFSPIVPSYLRTFQFSQGTNVIYRPDSAAIQPFALEDSWWKSDDSQEQEAAGPDSTPTRTPLLPGMPDNNPAQAQRFFNPHSIGGDFISLGVADLMAVLRDRELRAEKGELDTNPFEEALKESSSESTSDKTKKTAETDSSKKDDQKKVEKTTEDVATDGGNSMQSAKTFLIVGRFSEQPVSIMQATAQAPLLNQSGTNAAVFDISGSKQIFDLSIVLRNRDNRESVAFGDLNEDGYLDLAVTNRQTDQTTVYMNDGNGNFIPCRIVYGGLGPGMTAISDFSGDGSVDVAVMLLTDQRIIVDGKGLRKFIFYPTSDTGAGYESMIPYDFTGDGLPDLLLSDFQSSTLTVYRNIGQAKFVPSENYPMQAFPLIQSGADFGRGVTDTILVQYIGDHISIALQNGLDGTITSLANTILGPSAYYVVGDFDQDGVVDIAIAHRE
jgi:hypothetical protein